MADVALRADSARANPVFRIIGTGDFDTLLTTLHTAKARADLAWAESDDGELSEDLAERYSDALNAFMLSPASSMRHLAEKLAVFQAERLASWYLADAFVAALVSDARRLADTMPVRLMQEVCNV